MELTEQGAVRFPMRYYLMPFLLSSLLVSGCIMTGEGSGHVNFDVDLLEANGTIRESYVDGDLISAEPAVFEFNFSNTDYHRDFVSYGIEAEGRVQIVSSSEADVVRIEIRNHGVHRITLMAEDIMGNEYIDYVTVSANLEIHWIEEDTHEPRPLLIDSIPSNHDVAADVIVIESMVRNPELIQGLGSGQSVEFSWDLIDEAQITCQSNDGKVDDGGEVVWKTLHFDTYGVHELQVTYDSGQDYIDVEHMISLVYPESGGMALSVR